MVSTAKWLAFRKQFLKGKRNFEGYYTCEHCGKWVKNIEVDHRQRRGSHPGLALDEANLQLLCHDCHQAKDGGLT